MYRRRYASTTIFSMVTCLAGQCRCWQADSQVTCMPTWNETSVMLADPTPSTRTESLSKHFERLFRTISASPALRATEITLVTCRKRNTSYILDGLPKIMYMWAYRHACHSSLQCDSLATQNNVLYTYVLGASQCKLLTSESNSAFRVSMSPASAFYRSWA